MIFEYHIAATYLTYDAISRHLTDVTAAPEFWSETDINLLFVCRINIILYTVTDWSSTHEGNV